jgi:AcrR family transcriptional regulator
MKHEMKKNHILDATFKCVYEHGINGISMRSIAQEAKVNQAMLHYYFGNKDNLLLEFLIALFKRFVYDIKRAYRTSDPPEKKILNVFQISENYVAEQKEIFVALIDLWTLSIRNLQMQKLFSNLYLDISALIEGMLKEGIEKGVFNNVKTEIASLQFLAFMQGISLLWHMQGESFDLREHYAVFRENFLNLVIKDRGRKTIKADGS